MTQNFYVSTPIYYVNGAPHIGHAYTTLVADVFARFYRQQGADVFFQTGTDEHGLKVQREAEKQGITPQKLADQNSDLFVKLFQDMKTSHTRFIRTTEKVHHEVVTEVVKRMQANDDIYLDRYAGWYAAADEAFYNEDEVEDGKAIATGASVEWVEEESYFFRLSKYQDKLLEWYRSRPDTIVPDVRKNEVVSFVEGGLRDLSISRTTFDWGIPFPNDPKHVLYVWVDALTNYITGVGAFHDEEQFKKYWPCDCHLIGKDILRFHAVYWPAFLFSAGIEPPRQIAAHGWWLNEGQKMSKSKNNFLDAFALIKEYNLDVLRYYLLREIPLGNDGNFMKSRLIERNNGELADNLGNLVNRTTRMSQGFVQGKVPAYVETNDELDQEIRRKAIDTRDAVVAHMNARETHKALERITAFSGDLNQYVHHTAPWALNKKGETERLQQVLYHALEGIRWLGVLSAAFIPDAANKILAAYELEGDDALNYESIQAFGGLAEGTPIKPPKPLFLKIDVPKSEDDEPKAKKQKNKQKNKAKNKEPAKDDGTPKKIKFDDFMKVEIRVGHVLSAERVEGAEKLLKLSVNLGEEEPRTVVAGIAKYYEPDQLVGLKLGMIANLKPSKIFGIRSEAMCLAVETADNGLVLTTYDADIAPGTRVH